MIKTPDFKIKIGFDQNLSGRPYYKVFRKDEPYQPVTEDYKELAEVFDFLSFRLKRHVEEMEKMAQESALKGPLENLDVNQARRLLSHEGKRLWVDFINAKTGGCGYTLAANGDIVDVPMEGVWR